MRHVIAATGGMHFNVHLAGMLTPQYSYLVALPHPPRLPLPPAGGRNGGIVRDNDNGNNWGGMMESPDSPNFFTLGFSHGWCIESDFVRISREENFSGLEQAQSTKRCRNFAECGQRKYPYLDPYVPYPWKHGVYSKTANFLLLVGMPSLSGQEFYMVGCNTWGQALLSAITSWAPALLGYRNFHPDKVNGTWLCSIGRFVGRDLVVSVRASCHSRTMRARKRL
jgi:hypothetical protein